MNRKINKNFLIIGAMILATVLAFLLISVFSKNNPKINPGVVTEAALKEEILQLESNLLELELVFGEKDLQVENFETLLDEKYVELDNMTNKVRQMEEKIDQLEREGKVDKATIREMREKLAEAKGKIVDNLKAEINLLVFDLGSLTRRGDSLKRESDSLKSAYNDCQSYANSVASTSTAPPINTDPDPIIPVANTRADGFYAENIKVDFLDNKDKNVKTNRPNTKDKIETIDFTFDFEGVGDVSLGDKRLFLVLKHKQSGQTVVREGYGDSGQPFRYKGQTLISTFRVLPKYTGRTQPLRFNFPVADALANALAGTYEVLVYWEKSPTEVQEIGKKGGILINS